MIETVIENWYRTSDGKKFTTMEAATSHEASIKMGTAIAEYLSKQRIKGGKGEEARPLTDRALKAKANLLLDWERYRSTLDLPQMEAEQPKLKLHASA